LNRIVNPDDYIDIYKNNITSCWTINSIGICIVNKTKVNEWNERLNTLRIQIQYWIENIPSKEVEVIQLFYDEN
jgi:hypothetical protein